MIDGRCRRCKRCPSTSLRLFHRTVAEVTTAILLAPHSGEGDVGVRSVPLPHSPLLDLFPVRCAVLAHFVLLRGVLGASSLPDLFGILRPALTSQSVGSVTYFGILHLPPPLLALTLTDLLRVLSDFCGVVLTATLQDLVLVRLVVLA